MYMYIYIYTEREREREREGKRYQKQEWDVYWSVTHLSRDRQILFEYYKFYQDTNAYAVWQE